MTKCWWHIWWCLQQLWWAFITFFLPPSTPLPFFFWSLENLRWPRAYYDQQQMPLRHILRKRVIMLVAVVGSWCRQNSRWKGNILHSNFSPLFLPFFISLAGTVSKLHQTTTTTKSTAAASRGSGKRTAGSAAFAGTRGTYLRSVVQLHNWRTYRILNSPSNEFNVIFCKYQLIWYVLMVKWRNCCPVIDGELPVTLPQQKPVNRKLARSSERGDKTRRRSIATWANPSRLAPIGYPRKFQPTKEQLVTVKSHFFHFQIHLHIFWTHLWRPHLIMILKSPLCNIFSTCTMWFSFVPCKILIANPFAKTNIWWRVLTSNFDLRIFKLQRKWL
jgi:hypothetical protein